MAVFSIIKLSELEGAKILAPEFYHSAKIISKRYLENVCTKRIKDYFYSVREIFDPKNEHLTQEGVVFDLSDITSYFLYGGKKVTSSEEIGSTKKIFLQNDVLISRLRPYLKEVSFIGFNGKLKLASTEFIVLRQKRKTYCPETLFAYLISEEVQNILIWSITGTEHPRFNEDYFLKLSLPDFSERTQKEIKKLVQSAWKIFLDSLEFYSQAENLLLQELGLKDFKPKYEKTYTANLSDAFSVHRIDAEYFQPAYEEIEKYLREKFYAKPIKQLNYIEVTTGQYSEKYVDASRGLPYIRGTDLKMGTIDTADLVYISPEDQIESKKAKEGDIVVTRVGTIGLSARIPKECEGGTISDNLIRLRFDQQKLNSYYLALFLGSPLGVSLMMRNSRGSVQQRLNQETLKEVVIPLLPLSTQQKIASLVQESHEARRKAKELLEVAKRAVEIAIEQSEDEALRYITEAMDNKD